MIRPSLLVALPLAFVSAAAIAQYAGLSSDVLLETETTVLGQPIAYPDGAAKFTSTILTFAPGAETAWHIHAVPLFVHVLEGEITVDYGDKGVKVLKAGDTIVEAMNWPHKGMNKSDKPVRLLTVYAGADGTENAEVVDAPK